MDSITMKKNLTKDLVKDIKVSKVVTDPNSFVPSLKVEFSISLEQLQDIDNTMGLGSKEYAELIGDAIWKAIKNRE